MTINELKLMNKQELIIWCFGAKVKDLNDVLKAEDIKGLSKLKKADKVKLLVNMIDIEENVTDDEIEKVMDDTRKLNEEINVRQSYEEEKIEETLYARLKAKEITWEEFKQAVINYNLSIPINVANEGYSIKLIDKHCFFYSYYEHDDYDNNTYYSVVNKEFTWDNVFKNYGKYNMWQWIERRFYEKNTVDKDGLQLAFDFDSDSDWEYILLVYKNYELLGYYINGDIDNIMKLVAYDDQLSYEDFETYEELLELLEKQHEEYDKILKVDNMLRKKINNNYSYTNFSLSIK